MSYYKILGFQKEPFSTSPDPEFFYLSKEHEAALTNILIELRLRRGLSVILGDIGTGKTTLSRKLIQELKGRSDFIFSIVLDPSFEDEKLFLTSLARNFDIDVAVNPNCTILDLRESIEQFLLKVGASESKIVTLIIDEAQKLNESSLEVLRVLLNYETNEFKLLQLVLLGQMELHAKIMDMANFYDRISLKYTLNPLDPDETRELIEFRIKQAGYKANMHLFLKDSIAEIHRISKGYPRRITMICHRALKYLVIKKKTVVTAKLIQDMMNQETKTGWQKRDPQLQRSNY